MGAQTPLIGLPASNGPSSFNPNQIPNSFESDSAFHTR